MTKASDTANILKQPFTNTLGTSNYRAGVNAGDAIASGGNENVLVGDEAGTALTTGDDNVAIGFRALSTEDTGTRSVAIGHDALRVQNNDSTNYNVAVGFGAGEEVTTGIQNVLVGALAGDALTDADYNTAVGMNALTADTLGSNSTAIGNGALASQNFTSATASQNVAVGNSAGYAVTTGTKNTLIGHGAGDALTDADQNVYIGADAGGSDDLGNKQVAVGSGALATCNYTGATDGFNVAVGMNALNVLETAVQNVAVGSSAGGAITTGSYNVCIGQTAGNHGNPLTTGSPNILIGAYSHPSAADGSHQIVMGYNVVGSGNGTFTVGNVATDTTLTLGGTSLSAPSDERYKEEITTSTAGLSFIDDLRPVTFKWKKEKDIPTDHRAYVADSDTRVMEKGEKVQHGFIAQEVKTVIDNHPEIKDGFDMWSADANDGRQRLAEGELIPILVKAIQELSAKVKALEDA